MNSHERKVLETAVDAAVERALQTKSPLRTPPEQQTAVLPHKTHEVELGIEFCIELLIVFYQLGRELMGLPPNVPLGAGCWALAMVIAIRIFWIIPITNSVPVLVKVITAFLIFAIAVQLSRHTVQEAYRKQSAGEQLTPDTKILLSAINALGGKAQGESKHTHVSFFDPLNRDVAGAPKWPFHAGDRPVVPISMWNSGDFYLNERANAGTVIIANRDYALSKKMFDDFLQNAKYLSAGSGVPPHDQASGTYGTYQGPIITQREAEALLKMEKAVCAMSRIEWQDETGCYATDFCECEWFEPPPSNYNWHTCKSHSGTEAKIECSPR